MRRCAERAADPSGCRARLCGDRHRHRLVPIWQRDSGYLSRDRTTAEAGAVPAEIYSDLYERDTLGRLRLAG